MASSLKIRTASRGLELACQVLVAFYALVGIGALLGMTVAGSGRTIFMSSMLMENYTYASLSVAESPWARIFYASLTVLHTALTLYAYWCLSRMFALFRDEEFFSDKAAGKLFIFSLINLVNVALPFAITLAWLAASSSGVGVHAYLPVIAAAVPGLIAAVSFLIISWIIREGVRLRLENEGFV